MVSQIEHALSDATNVTSAAQVQSSGLASLVIVARHHGLHLSVPQLIHENVLPHGEVSNHAIIECAKKVGLAGEAVQLDWPQLSELKQFSPAIVRLKTGRALVLLRLIKVGDATHLVLQDPLANEAEITIDQIRFEEAWSGELVLIKRDYSITDERQPFSLRFLTALLLKERGLLRDTALSAFMLGLIALGPIIVIRVMNSRVLYSEAMSTFIVLCVGLVLILIFETAFGFLRQYLVLNLTTRVDVRLGTYIFHRVLNLPMDFFERNPVGLIARDMREVFRIRQFLTGSLCGTILDSTTLVFFLPVMFFFSPILTTAVLVICALIVAWLLLMMPVHRSRSTATLAAEGDQGAFMVQTLYGIRTVKSLALEARQRRMWDSHVARVAKLRFAEGYVASIINAGVKPLQHLAVYGTYALGVYLVLESKTPAAAGTLFAFLLLAQRVVQPLIQVAQLVHQYDDVRSAVSIVSRLVNQPEEEGHGGQGVFKPIQGNVQFSQVYFKYKGAASYALKDVSFEISRGMTFGIMGRSGSGKTTITRLVQRLHSEYDGLIKIDGVDVREYDVDHLRRSVGVVLQENFLFSGTIRENIMAAKSDASFDDVVRAARLAGAEEFIDKLPRGYDTHIYEGSPNLSGGQRQRLAIARALIIDPAILILDEATSALDAESEAIVNANLARIAQGRTVIVISHRLSSLAKADAILVLEQGAVADVGKHDELMSRSEIYSSLWHEQNQHVIGANSRKIPLRGPSLVS